MFVFLSSSDLKSHFEGKLDLVKQFLLMQIFEFTKSLNLASNLKKNLNIAIINPMFPHYN